MLILKKIFIWGPLSVFGIRCPRCGSKNISTVKTFDSKKDKYFPDMGDNDVCQNCGKSW